MKQLSQIITPAFMREIKESGQYDFFPDDFFWWLKDNDKIWLMFEDYALRMAANRKRFSARTIIEVMRWNNDIRQKNPLFKISNNAAPGLARLWMLKHSKQHPNFFSLRNI